MIEQANFLLLPVDENDKNVKKYNETNSSFHILLRKRISRSDTSTLPRGTGTSAPMVTPQSAGVFWLAAGSSLLAGVGAACLQSPVHSDGLDTLLGDQNPTQSC